MSLQFVAGDINVVNFSWQGLFTFNSCMVGKGSTGEASPNFTCCISNCHTNIRSVGAMPAVYFPCKQNAIMVKQKDYVARAKQDLMARDL